jgi:hypothetical protein
VRHCGLFAALVTLHVGAFAAVPDALSAASAQPSESAAKGNEIDEIVVRGTRLSELRSGIIAAENRFYSRYNELNTIRDFEISCIMDAPTGQKKKVRRCRTGLEVRARTEEAEDILNSLQRSTSTIGGGDVASRTTNVDIMSLHLTREEQFRQHFLQLVNNHADLRALLDEREARQAVYDKELARRSSGRLVTW